MQPSRIVEILAPGRRGSGYLLDGRLVLTCRHVVETGAASEVHVRSLTSEGWTAARLVWRGTGCDVALLELHDEQAGLSTRTRLGCIAGYEPVSCSGVGFPQAQARGHHIVEPEQLGGTIYPITRAKSRLLSITVESGAPIDQPDSSPWAGASGAAVFSRDLLVGVLRSDPTGFGPDRLDATPISEAAKEPGFRALLDDDAAGLDAVEAQGLLERAYEPRANTGAAPSFLLHPRHGVVGFRGRDEELGWLREWCRGRSPLEVALIIGRGGSGKSRLARELCQRLAHEDGWVTGLLTRSAPPAQLSVLARLGSGLLAVVDYAETRQSQVIALLEALAGQRDPAAPLRVLLVARWEGDWWSQLPGTSHEPDVREALARAPVRELVQDEPDADGRRQAYLRARADFERFTGPSSSTPHVPALDDPIFEHVLFIHLRALSDLPGGDTSVPRLLGGDERSIREELLDATLYREAVHWKDTAAAATLTISGTTREQAVAVSTLTTPNAACTPTNAYRAADLLTVLGGVDSSLGLATARWLHALYPTADEGWIAPLEPDLLGEAQIARVLRLDGRQAGRELVTRLVDKLDASATHRVLTVLTRGAADHVACDAELRELMTSRTADVWQIALDVAVETGDPIGRHLAGALETAPRPELIGEIVRALPKHTVALREVAVVTLGQALQHARAEDPGSNDVARLASDLGHRLTEVGRPEDALNAVEEALTIRRRLANQRPAAFMPELAGILGNQSTCLGALGRQEDALAAVEEAVRIDRELACHDGRSLDLAGSLNNLSGCLSAVARYEDALVAIGEAIAIRRELTEGPATHELANSLTLQSSFFIELAQHQEASAAISEAIVIRRKLAEGNADAFLPDLANSLNVQSVALRGLERLDEALAAIEEATAIRRNLAVARPSLFLLDLAQSLINKSVFFGELRRYEKALQAVGEAVVIFRSVEGGDDASSPNLALSLSNQSNAFGKLGDHESALAAITEAVDIYRRLGAAQRDVYLPMLATTLCNQSLCLSNTGRDEDALSAIDEAVGIHRTLALARPRVFLPELARSLRDKSRQLESPARGARGRTRGGRAARRARLPRRTREKRKRQDEHLDVITETVEIYRALVDEGRAFLSQLAGSLRDKSLCLTERGDRRSALTAINEAIKIFRGLAHDNPDDILPDVAASLEHKARCLQEMESNEDALNVMNESVVIFRALARARPDAFLARLGVSLSNQANCLYHLDDDEKALLISDEAVEIFEGLALSDSDAFEAALTTARDINIRIRRGTL